MTVKSKLAELKARLDAIMHNEDGVDYWLARELMKLLGYTSWQNFSKTLNRAMESCQTVGVAVPDHFNEAVKLIRAGLTESEKRLSQNIYERGVAGDRPLADFLPTVTIAAKNLATELTNYNVEEKDLCGRYPIAEEHVQNNTAVRGEAGRPRHQAGGAAALGGHKEGAPPRQAAGEAAHRRLRALCRRR